MADIVRGLGGTQRLYAGLSKSQWLKVGSMLLLCVVNGPEIVGSIGSSGFHVPDPIVQAVGGASKLILNLVSLYGVARGRSLDPQRSGIPGKDKDAPMV